MIKLAYLFERFPSFTQTFCYREVMELRRQGCAPTVFSIRPPEEGPAENWDTGLVRQVNYLPEEKSLVRRCKTPFGEPNFRMRQRKRSKIGGGRRIFCAFIKPPTSGCDCRKAFTCTRILREWRRGPLTGSNNSLASHSALPLTLTTFLFRVRLRLVSIVLIETASSVVTESEYAANYLRARFPQDAAKIQCVYNGLDLSSFPRADFASPVPLVISVGRLIEKKGFSDLIAACRILAESGHNFRCEIIGEGPLENDLRAQIEGSNLREKVTLAGAQPQAEIKRRFATANVFALACTTDSSGGTDNLPTVIMEAMATGLPVVSTTLAGIPEMVQPGITGELVPPNAPQELARAIEKIITDPARAREFGINGLAVAHEKFSIETSVKNLLSLFGPKLTSGEWSSCAKNLTN